MMLITYSVGLYKRKPIVDVLLRPTASMVISSSGGTSSVTKRRGYFNWPPVASVKTSTQSTLRKTTKEIKDFFQWMKISYVMNFVGV